MHQRAALTPPSLGAVCVVVAFTVLVALRSIRRGSTVARQSLALTTCLTLGIGWAQWTAHDRLASRIPESTQGAQRVVDAVIEQMPIAADVGVRLVVRVVRCHESGGDCRVGQRVRLTWRTPGDAIEPGQWWQFQARWRLPHGPLNPHGFDAELRALQDDIAATGNVQKAHRLVDHPLPPEAGLSPLRLRFERWRTHLAQRITEATPSLTDATRGVLLGLVIGDQSAIGASWWALFNRTGIGHLLSISGGHVTMFAAISAALAAATWRNRWLSLLCVRSTGRPIAAWVSRPQACWAVGVVAAFAYAGLAGWGLPAQRTCWMLLAAGLTALSGRARGPVTVLGAALLVIVVADPWAPLSPGCWLSFMAVGVILMVSQRRSIIDDSARPWRRRATELLRDAGRAQWAVTLIMLPLGAWFFASASWIGPVVNLIAIPLVSMLITPAAIVGALAAVVSIDLGAAALGVTGQFVELAVVALQRFDAWADGARQFTFTLGVPGMLVLMIAMAGCLGLLLPWPIRFRPVFGVALLPLLVTSAASTSDDTLSVHVIDVGQGMAVLIEGPGYRLLYDTGPRFGETSDAGARIVVPWLKSRGITRLDALVISHDDDDHVGGALSVLAAIDVDHVHGALPVMHPVAQAAKRFTPCRRGEGWQWQQARFEWLHPWRDGDHPATATTREAATRARTVARVKDNALSCVLRIDSPAGSVLLPGDIEARQERDLLQHTPAERLRADLLLAPHHGSQTSSTQPFVAAVDPQMVVFQAGYRNRFEHPRVAVVDRYRARCARLLRSDASGAITITMRAGEPWQVNRWRVDGARYWHVDMSALDEDSQRIVPPCA